MLQAEVKRAETINNKVFPFSATLYLCTSKSEGIIALMTPLHLFDNFITRYLTDLVDKVYEVVKAPSTFR